MDDLMPLCYSQRRLNPFRGVMSVIETGDTDSLLLFK